MHFSNVVSEYRRYRPRYPVAVALFLAEITPSRSVVWEAGCGSGQFTTSLATAFDFVVASDASPAAVAAAPDLPNVRWLVEDAGRSALAGGVADLCVAAQAAHWFDLRRYYQEVVRIGKRDGRIALVTYGDVTTSGRLGVAIQQFAAGVLAPCWPPQRRHVEQRYRDFWFPFDEIPAPRFVLRQRWTRDELLGYVRTWSSTAALAASGRSEELGAFEQRVREAWSADDERREFTWPLTVRIGALQRPP